MGLYICIASGWKDGSIYDRPVFGIKETIATLRNEGYEIVIHSSRCHMKGGIEAIKEWLQKYDIEVDDVVRHKPPALMYVDDRAIPFNGNCTKLLERIHDFEPWTKLCRKECICCGRTYLTSGLAAHYSSKYCSEECREKDKKG